MPTGIYTRIKKGKIIKCKICNKEFYVFPSRNKQCFCSCQCANIFRIGKPNLKNIGKNNVMYGRCKDKHPNWKGGKIRHSQGYILIHFPKHPFATKSGYVMGHRLIMEKFLKRYLNPKEIVHHINKNIIDNRIENLQIMSKSEHISKHNILNKWSHNFNECRRCHSTKHKHNAMGLCTLCYRYMRYWNKI